MSGSDASKALAPYLWEFEKSEILEIESVYYFNISERLKQANANQIQALYSQRGSS
jgi:hypothetical protein